MDNTRQSHGLEIQLPFPLAEEIMARMRDS